MSVHNKLQSEKNDLREVDKDGNTSMQNQVESRRAPNSKKLMPRSITKRLSDSSSALKRRPKPLMETDELHQRETLQGPAPTVTPKHRDVGDTGESTETGKIEREERNTILGRGIKEWLQIVAIVVATTIAVVILAIF